MILLTKKKFQGHDLILEEKVQDMNMHLPMLKFT